MMPTSVETSSGAFVPLRLTRLPLRMTPLRLTHFGYLNRRGAAAAATTHIIPTDHSTHNAEQEPYGVTAELSPDVVAAIVSHLPLLHLQRALQIDRTFRVAIKARCQRILRLLHGPFAIISPVLPHFDATLHLEQLDLRGRPIHLAGVVALAEIAEHCVLPQLHTLSLNESEVGDEGALALAHALGHGGLPALRELSLARCQLGDAGVSALITVAAAAAATAAGGCAPPALGKLERLYLARNRISDLGVASMARAIEESTGLRERAGRSAAGGVAFPSRLEYVFFEGNPGRLEALETALRDSEERLGRRGVWEALGKSGGLMLVHEHVLEARLT